MTIDYEKLLTQLRKEQAVEAHYDTKQCAVIEQAATAIETLRAELAHAKADSRGICTNCEDTGVTTQTERLCACASGQAERLGRELASTKARLGEAVGCIEFLMEMSEPPERNCRCHISPPCSWCEEYAGIVEARDHSQAFLAKEQNQ
jgi:hypothetical protein